MNQQLSVRDALRSALREAMRERDRLAVATYRTALARIDNAEAVPIADSVDVDPTRMSIGVGSSEVERRSLSEAQMCALVAEEADERDAASAVHVGDLALQHRRAAELLRQL